MALTVVPAETRRDSSAPVPNPRPSSQAAPTRVRDPWLDNARLCAALLIVVGHFLMEVVARSSIAELAWSGTWAFRLPVYVVIAGLFTSAERLDRRRGTTLLRNVLFVYVVFDLLHTLQRHLNGQVAVYDPFEPDYGLWFLVSLFCWRVALPYVARVPRLGWWACVVAIGAGFLPSVGTAYGVSRTLALFPLFVLGWRLQDADLRARLATVPARLVALVAAGALVVVLAALVRSGDLRLGEFVMKAPYRGDVSQQTVEAAARLGLLAAGAVGALAVLALVPQRRLPFVTVLGAGSMSIYLLHLLVVRQLADAGYFRTVDSRTDLALMVLLAVVLVLVLGSTPVRRVTRPLVQPRSFPWERVAVPRLPLAGRVR